MTSNLQQAKTTQAVSAYLNSAAHPDQVRQMADALGNPDERAVARQLAPAISAAKQAEINQLAA